MSRLVSWVMLVFLGVSALTVARWLLPDFVRDEAPQQLKASASATESGVGEAREAEGAGQRTGSSLGAPVKIVVNTVARESESPVERDLALGLTLGFTPEEAQQLVARVDLEHLEAFFARRSHIDTDWLHRNGLTREHLRILYTRWAAGTTPEGVQNAPETLMLSRFSPSHDGGPLRVQDSFRTQDRTVFLHYQVPEQYVREDVVIRWTKQDEAGLSHFDYHPLTGDPSQRQEAWIRPRDGWEPGVYRVEVYGTDPSLPLIAQRDYEVLP